MPIGKTAVCTPVVSHYQLVLEKSSRHKHKCRGRMMHHAYHVPAIGLEVTGDLLSVCLLCDRQVFPNAVLIEGSSQQ